ncbi:MAG: SRPBCC domain-containing protein [Gemmatimonadales bacterium]
MTRRRSRYRYRAHSPVRSSMATIAALVATPILTVVLLASVGQLLPRQQGASLTRVFPEAPEVLWQLITDLDDQPTWRRGLTKVERLPDQGGRTAWLEFRGRDAEAVRVADARAPLRLVTERVGEDAAGEASWEWELAPVEDGSRLTLTRQVMVHQPLARAVGFVFQAPRRDVERALADLSARVARAERLRTTALNQ